MIVDRWNLSIAKAWTHKQTFTVEAAVPKSGHPFILLKRAFRGAGGYAERRICPFAWGGNFQTQLVVSGINNVLATGLQHVVNPCAIDEFSFRHQLDLMIGAVK